MLEALDAAADHYLTLPEESRSISTLNIVANNVPIVVEERVMGWMSPNHLVKTL